MLRLTHRQTVSGPIVINDIDDGLPNKTARGRESRAKVSGIPVLVNGGILAPSNYRKDGNSLSGRDKSTLPEVNYPKQKCYVPYYKLLSNGTYDKTIAGYIDIVESDRVLLSQDHGVIAGLLKTITAHPEYPLITVTSFTAADVAAPTLTSAVLRRGTGASIAYAAGTVTLTDAGASFVAGDVGKKIRITGATNPGNNGTFTIATVPSGTQVTFANASGVDSDSGNYVIELVITGTNLTSLAPDITSVVVTGTGATTFRQSQFYSISATVIRISVQILGSIAVTTSSVKIIADNKNSATVAVT